MIKHKHDIMKHTKKKMTNTTNNQNITKKQTTKHKPNDKTKHHNKST